MSNNSHNSIWHNVLVLQYNDMKFIKLSLVSLIILISSIIIFSPPSFAQQFSETKDFFYFQDKPSFLNIQTDQLGIVVTDGTTSDQLQKYLSTFKLKFVQEYPQGIFIFNLPESMPRSDIVNLSRTIASEGVGIIDYAGLVAIPAESKSPFIVTDEFIVQFKSSVSSNQIAVLNENNGVEILMPDPFVKNQFLFKVTKTSPSDVLDLANLYHQSDLTVFAHPNFVSIIDFRQFVPNDPLFGNQWHHQNTGQSGGTIDADVDTPLAWPITQGVPGVIIAVIDSGFDITHPDLTPNFWVNVGEIPGNGVDRWNYF